MYAGSRRDRPAQVIRGGFAFRGGLARWSGEPVMAIFDSRLRIRTGVTALLGAAVFMMAATFMMIATGADPASAQGAVKSVHGDWQIRCDTPPGAQGEQCALMQSVTAEDRPNIGLTVIVLKTSDQKSRLMRVVAPLGVLLPSGLGLKIDNQDVGRAGFVRCLPNGCVAEVVMDDNLIKQLRNGQTSTFIIFQTPEEGIGFPMSLKGFGEGYDQLP
jgi:invasion protein IalB